MTRHNRNSQGFTIIEMLVVIIVLSILVSIGIVSYSGTQQRTRDNQRKNDIIALKTELEQYYGKNGEYPSGCFVASCTGSYFIGAAPIINGNTTLATLRTAFPDIASTFGDPTIANTKPFLDRDLADKKYFYIGGLANTTAGSVAYSVAPAGSTFTCTIAVTLPAGSISSYLVGYYSEVTATWTLFHGRQGTQFTINGSTSGAAACNTTATS